MIELRDYQAQMIADIRRQWAAGKRRVLGVMPTGSGKTEVAIQIIADMPEISGRALIVVERKTLCRQWEWRLRQSGIHRYIGILQGENTRMIEAPLLLATAQTIRSRGVPEGVALVVIDESHIWHRTHDDVLDALGDARVLGLTATPLRAGLGLRFEAVVIGARIRELMTAGYLVPKARYFAPKADAIEEALRQVAIRAGDFATGQLSEAMRNRAIIGDAVGEWRQRGEDRQTIAFCVDKQHARDLAAEFTTAGVSAEVILDDTEDADRSRHLDAFEAGDLRVLCSVGVLGVGFDSPVASCAILARPTLSYSLYIQQGGRVLRPYEGKADALVLDHAGNTHRFGLLEDFDPPTTLSMIDKDSDRRPRHASSGVWCCRNCEAINPASVTICEECGTPLRRHSAVVLLDGELQSVQYGDGETLPGPTVADIQRTYRMFVHYGQAKGMKSACGWAWFACQRRYGISEAKARKPIPWDWRALAPLPPDEATARWLTADFQRSRIISRYHERQGKGPDNHAQA